MNGVPVFCGVDIGAASTKVVLVEADGTVRARVVMPSGVDYGAIAADGRRRALEEAQAEQADLVATVSTGYGRRNVDFAARTLTEIQCHGVGCYHFFPAAIIVVDIGGQDNKVIRLDEAGRRLDFKMNRKCAAGTGAFIEEIALRLGLDLGQLDGLAASVDRAVSLSSFCTVFAKTEILSHLRSGEPVAEIVRGAFHSVVSRVLEMDPLRGRVVLTGGVVAHNPTVAKILSERLGTSVEVPPFAQFTGAFGAALVAREFVGSNLNG